MLIKGAMCHYSSFVMVTKYNGSFVFHNWWAQIYHNIPDNVPTKVANNIVEPYFHILSTNWHLNKKVIILQAIYSNAILNEHFEFDLNFTDGY